jgi:hypothetical protein
MADKEKNAVIILDSGKHFNVHEYVSGRPLVAFA